MRFLPFLAIRFLAPCLALSGVLSCSSDSTSPPEAPEGEVPATQVRIISPVATAGRTIFLVIDEFVDIYVTAANYDGEEGVRLWRPSSGDETVEVGSTTTTIPFENLPADIRPDLDPSLEWEIFHLRWQPSPDSEGQSTLLASVTDPRGDAVYSEALQLLVYFGDAEPPRANFVIVPPEGRVGRQLEFDPIGDPEHPLTFDYIDRSSDLSVRWDFDGDENWDIDWDAQLTPLDRPTWVYERPGDYAVRMEARNTYVGYAARAEQVIHILP